MIYTYFKVVADCTVTVIITITVTLTVTLTVTVTVTITIFVTVILTIFLNLTLKKVKWKCLDSKFCLNRFLKWEMTCEASVGVSVKTVTVLSWTILFCVGDRMTLKMSFYVES